MEMFDLRADYKTLPDETLRRHFRRLIKRQRRFAAFTFALLIPAAIIYGMMGWANFFASACKVMERCEQTGLTACSFSLII